MHKARFASAIPKDRPLRDGSPGAGTAQAHLPQERATARRTPWCTLNADAGPRPGPDLVRAREPTDAHVPFGPLGTDLT